MKKSLEDIRRQYGEKSDDSGRDSASSNGRASNQAIQEDEPPPKLNDAPKNEARSCPEFVKPHQQLPPTADLSKIDFSSSVIAGDLGQLYTNETVFNVFSESLCNSSLKSNIVPSEVSVDENIVQGPNLDFSKTDFSSSSAANSFSNLYTNESLAKLFPGSLNRSADQGAPTAACNDDLKKRIPPSSNDESASFNLGPPAEARDIPITLSSESGDEVCSSSMNRGATDQPASTDACPSVMKQSSLIPNDAPKEPIPFDDMIQQVLTFCKTDFSSGSAANNLHTLYTQSTRNIFHESLNCFAIGQGLSTTSCHVSKQQTLTSSVAHRLPVEAREPLPIDPGLGDSSSSDCNNTSENHQVAQLHPHPLSDGDIPSRSGVRNSNSQSNSQIATGSQRMSNEQFHELMVHQVDQFVNPNPAAKPQSIITEKKANGTKNSEDGNQPASASSSPDGQLTPTGIPESFQGLMAHPSDELVKPNVEDLTAIICSTTKKRAIDTKNAKICSNDAIANEIPQEVNSYEKIAEKAGKSVSPAVHSFVSSFEPLLSVIPEEKRGSGVSQPTVSPPIGILVSSRIPAGNDSNATNPEQSIGNNSSKETLSDEAKHEPHSQSVIPTNATSSDPVESTESTHYDCRENVSECPIPLTAGDKARPVDELPVESTNTGHCVDEPEIGALPKPRDYLEHDWYFQKIRRLVLGTSGCYYEGEILNNKMHGDGRFYCGQDQYIEGTWEMNKLILPKASILTLKPCNHHHRFSHLGSRFTIFKIAYPYFMVSIYNGYNFVAITAPLLTFRELDFNESVDELKASFLGRFQIAEIIHDEWRSKRNTSLEEFKVALEVSTAEEVDVIRNATILFFLSKFAIKNYSTQSVLRFICRNDVFPSALRDAAGNLVLLEDSYQCKLRDICMLDCPDEMKPLHLDLRGIMSNMYTYRITEHRRSLLSECPNDFPRLTEMIKKLPDYKILYITRVDVGVFRHLLSIPCAQHDETYEFTQNLFKHFLEGFERKLLCNNNDVRPLELIPLIPPVFGYLFQSFSEIAGEIVSKADRLRFQDMLLIDIDGTWSLKSEISWASGHNISPESILYCQSLKFQYSAVAKMLHFFSPGRYIKYTRIADKIDILVEPVELERLSNERLAWLLILAKSIPSQNIQAMEAVKLYNPLFQCYVSFLRKSATDTYELFRVVAHSIVRFVITTITFTRQYVDSSVQQDTLLLEDLMSLVIPRISRELEGPTNFRDLMEELNRYWTLHRDIDFGTRHLPAGWRLVNVFVPFVVRPTVRLEVPLINLIRYLRSLNDFMNDLKDIDFGSCWYVKSDAYDSTVMEKVNNKLSSENCSYRVTSVDGFIKLMEGKTLPKHYILEIVREMMTYIMFHIANNWHKKELFVSLTAREKEAKAIEIAESAGMLLDVMKRSFLYLKEQPAYSDFETFKNAILEPFDGLVFKSRDFKEYKNRINMFMKESFWHTRSVNEIGIDQAISLFANVNDCPISGKLSDAYNLYLVYYNSNIETYSRHLRDKSGHVECLEAVKRSMEMPEHVHFSNWTEEFKTEKIPQLLAGLSAVWSILMSEGLSNSEKFPKPHCIQILCVLRLLSVGKPKGAENHLAQVSTGQGKSLILGLVSSVLALTGHKARVVCYSKYLSARDENYFEEFFQHFGIADAISYGTFDDMANGFFYPICNGKRTSLRRMVRDKVLHHTDWASLGSVKTESSDTVLLIDEVDVFFNDRFYGNYFDSLTAVEIPGLESIQHEMMKIAMGSSLDAERVKWLTDRHISEQINEGNPLYMLWDDFCRKPGSFHLLVDDANSKSLIQAYTNRSLVNEHLMMMSEDAILLGRSNKRDHLFKVNEKGLVCMRNSAGQYLPTAIKSYQNTFAYIKMTGDLDDKCFPNLGYLLLKTGKISYARLPCQFPLIIGVSGTLKDLTEYEKRGIDSYFREFSIVPSLFGESNLKFNAESDFKFVYKQNDWLKHIYFKVNEIVQSARAVLVFFDSDERLNLFANEYKTKFGLVNEITSNTDSKLRDRYITEAGRSRTVTLTTRVMGRGVDYESSVAVEKLGGIHVIQTFFSLDVKEEIQIRGRTARKDNEGSYELIICKEHLVHKRVISDDASEHTYSTLQPIRRKLMDDIGKHHADMISKSEHDHEMTMLYYGMAQFDKTVSDASIALENHWKSPGAQ